MALAMAPAAYIGLKRWCNTPGLSNREQTHNPPGSRLRGFFCQQPERIFKGRQFPKSRMHAALP